MNNETYGVKKTSREYKAGLKAKRFVQKKVKESNNECVLKTVKDKTKAQVTEKPT